MDIRSGIEGRPVSTSHRSQRIVGQGNAWSRGKETQTLQKAFDRDGRLQRPHYGRTGGHSGVFRGHRVTAGRAGPARRPEPRLLRVVLRAARRLHGHSGVGEQFGELHTVLHDERAVQGDLRAGVLRVGSECGPTGGEGSGGVDPST